MDFKAHQRESKSPASWCVPAARRAMRPGVRPGPERDERRRGVRRPALVSNAPHDARAVREPFRRARVVPRARRARRRARRDIWRRSDGRFGRLAATTTRELSRASLASISPPPPPRPRPELPANVAPSFPAPPAPPPPFLPPEVKCGVCAELLLRGQKDEHEKICVGKAARRRRFQRRARRRRRRRSRRSQARARARATPRPRAPSAPPRARTPFGGDARQGGGADRVPTKENVGPTTSPRANLPAPGIGQPRRRRRAQKAAERAGVVASGPRGTPGSLPPRTRWTRRCSTST